MGGGREDEELLEGGRMIEIMEHISWLHVNDVIQSLLILSLIFRVYKLEKIRRNTDERV